MKLKERYIHKQLKGFRVNKHMAEAYMAVFRRHRRKLCESMSDWAKREVEIACKREGNAYGCSCYRSALKAYNAMAADGHSGFSWGLTRNILTRLMDGLPLVPIEDTPENWNAVSFGDGCEHYQCTRMSSLFKDIAKDGTVTYSDVDRVVLVDVAEDGTETIWHSGLASRLIDRLYPITMPYYPPVNNQFKVYAKEFDSLHAEAGCYDTVCIYKLVLPDGVSTPMDLPLFYGENENGEMVEIDKNEYDVRLTRYHKALEAQKAG